MIIVVRELLVALGFTLDESKIKRADQGIESFKNHAESATAVFGRLAAVIGLVLGGREIVQMADVWTNVYAKISLVTQSAAEQAEIQQKVFEIAQRTRQEYESTGALYYKMALFSKELNASQQDVLDVTETVNKALVVGGASKMEANSTILQLSQALASGFLQGDELRALRENAPLLMNEMAKYLGTTIGGLKDMGAQGQLSSEKVFKAILSAKGKIDSQFKKMPVTVEQATTYALNRIGSLIFGINKETSVFQIIARGIQRAADGIADRIERVAKSVGGFTNAAKMAAYTVSALSLVFWLFRAKALSIGWVTTAVGLLWIWLQKVAKAAWALLMNPLFWKAMVIAAGIAAIALALEDIYYWATGGESVLGDMIGPFSEWEATLKPLSEAFSLMIDLLKKLVPDIDLVKAAIELLGAAIKLVLAPFILLLNLMKRWNNMGGFASIANFSGGLGMEGIAPFGVGPTSFAPVGSGPIVVYQNGDVNIEQNIAGAKATPSEIGSATSGAAEDGFDKFARDLAFAIPGGD